MSDSNNQFQSIFDSLQAHAPVIANSTAAERIDKLQRLYKAVYDLRDEISKAGLAELGMDGRFHLCRMWCLKTGTFQYPDWYCR